MVGVLGVFAELPQLCGCTCTHTRAHTDTDTDTNADTVADTDTHTHTHTTHAYIQYTYHIRVSWNAGSRGGLILVAWGLYCFLFP